MANSSRNSAGVKISVGLGVTSGRSTASSSSSRSRGAYLRRTAKLSRAVTWRSSLSLVRLLTFRPSSHVCSILPVTWATGIWNNFAKPCHAQAHVAQMGFTLARLFLGRDVFGDELRHGAGFAHGVVAADKIGDGFAERYAWRQ